MPLHVSSTCTHHQEVKIALHMCPKYVEAWNRLIVKQKFCSSSWLITEINILKFTVSKTSKLDIFVSWVGFQRQLWFSGSPRNYSRICNRFVDFLSCVQSVPFIVSLNTVAVTGNAGEFKIFKRLFCHGRWLDKRGTLPALFYCTSYRYRISFLNPLNAELNPICHLLALLGAHHILHVSRVRVKETN